MYLLQKEKQAKEENDFLKSKQSAWQQFQNRTQNKRRTLVAQGVISDRRSELPFSEAAFKKDSIFRTSEGTKRTSGASPTEWSMTPGPKRVNTSFHKSSLCFQPLFAFLEFRSLIGSRFTMSHLNQSIASILINRITHTLRSPIS